MADENGDAARYSRRAVLTAMVAGAAVAGAAGVGIGTAVAGEDDDAAGGSGGSADLKLDRTPVQPLARSQHATAVLAGGLVLCIGGISPSGTLASCQVYDPDSNEWYDAAPLARPRSFHSATPIDGGKKVLVLGGLDGEALSVASVFDPRADEWSRVKPLATPRYNHAATALSDGRIVLTGGFHRGPLTAAEIYEPEG